MKQIMNKSKRILEVEKNLHSDIESILWELYVKQNLPLHEIAQHLGITYKILLKWLDEAGLHSRKLNLERGDASK